MNNKFEFKGSRSNSNNVRSKKETKKLIKAYLECEFLSAVLYLRITDKLKRRIEKRVEVGVDSKKFECAKNMTKAMASYELCFNFNFYDICNANFESDKKNKSVSVSDYLYLYWGYNYSFKKDECRRIKKYKLEAQDILFENIEKMTGLKKVKLNLKEKDVFSTIFT